MNPTPPATDQFQTSILLVKFGEAHPNQTKRSGNDVTKFQCDAIGISSYA